MVQFVYMLLLPLPLLVLTTITTATTYYLLPQLPLCRRFLSRVGGPGFLQRLFCTFRHLWLFICVPLLHSHKFHEMP